MGSLLKKLLGKHEELPKASEKKDEELPKPLEIWKSWSKRHFNLQLYLVLASVLFLTTAAFPPCVSRALARSNHSLSLTAA